MTKAKCPFDKKACNEKCTLYRKGLRYWEDATKKPEPFEACAITVACDCLENLVTRSIGQQKAIEQTRNEMASLKELFFALAAKKAIENRVEQCVTEIESKKDNNVIEVVE